MPCSAFPSTKKDWLAVFVIYALFSVFCSVLILYKVSKGTLFAIDMVVLILIIIGIYWRLTSSPP